MTSRSETILATVLLLLAGAVYLPSVGGDFVYDDHRFVQLNPAVREGAALESYFLEPETQTADRSFHGLYRPLRTLSYRAVHLLSPDAPAQRVASLLLHLLNGWLVWRLLRFVLGPRQGGGALLGALAFVLHPLATESVAFISSRGDLLAMTGMLGAVLLYLRPGRPARLASLAIFLLALCSKESAVVLPGLLVLVDGFIEGPGRIRGRWRAYAQYGQVLLLWLAMRYLALGSGAFGQDGGLGLPGGELLASVFSSGVYYTAATTLPWWLTFELDLAASAGLATSGFFLAAALLFVAGRLRALARPATLAILWFPVALIPVTLFQFVFPLKVEIANRFAYPALVSFAMLLAFAATRRKTAFALAMIVLAAFVPLTVARAGVFKDERSLWTDVLETQPGHSRALYGLGVADLKAGEFSLARERLRRAALANPRNPRLAVHLATACRELASRQARSSPEYRRYVLETQSAYQAAVNLWAGGFPGGREHFRSVALEAAWWSMLAGDSNCVIADVEILLEADGALRPQEATFRHIEEISRFLDAILRSDLSEFLALEVEALRKGVKR